MKNLPFSTKTQGRQNLRPLHEAIALHFWARQARHAREHAKHASTQARQARDLADSI